MFFTGMALDGTVFRKNQLFVLGGCSYLPGQPVKESAVTILTTGKTGQVTGTHFHHSLPGYTPGLTQLAAHLARGDAEIVELRKEPGVRSPPLE